MRDPQGREIVAGQTTMRLAFMAAKAPFKYPAVAAMVADSLIRGRGTKKSPAWAVTRKGGR